MDYKVRKLKYANGKSESRNKLSYMLSNDFQLGCMTTQGKEGQFFFLANYIETTGCQQAKEQRWTLTYTIWRLTPNESNIYTSSTKTIQFLEENKAAVFITLDFGMVSWI